MHMEYRIDWDGKAYNRDEFRNYYSNGKRYRKYWAEAPEATDAQKLTQLFQFFVHLSNRHFSQSGSTDTVIMRRAICSNVCGDWACKHASNCIKSFGFPRVR